MDRVIVTVKRADTGEAVDLELSAHLPIRQVEKIVARALGWATDASGAAIAYAVGVYPPGRILDPEETLMQAEAWDGTWLLFDRRVPSGAPVPDVPAPSERPRLEWPVAGWDPITAPKSPSPQAAGASPAAGPWTWSPQPLDEG